MSKSYETPRQMLKSAQNRRQTGDRRRATFDYPSAFVAQILVNYEGQEPFTFKPARNAAVEAYSAGGKIGVRRAPSGIAHAKSV